MLYTNHDESLSTNIEERRSTKQYFSVETDTNSGAGREYNFSTEFAGSDLLYQVGRGYIINDTGAGTLYVKFKFTTKWATEAFGDGVEVLPGAKISLYPLPLLSSISIANVPADAGLNLLFRMFAT